MLDDSHFGSCIHLRQEIVGRLASENAEGDLQLLTGLLELKTTLARQISHPCLRGLEKPPKCLKYLASSI